ncbi:MAG: class D sortase [Acidimicrobiales bacterium]
MGLGILMLIGAGLALAYPVWWNHRSTTVGRSLIKSYGLPPPGLPKQPAATCVNPPQATNTQLAASKGAPARSAAGLVRIPALSLTAPVLEGLGDGVLAVAAGHDPSSPWPGGLGESVLESHDVSYFSQIDKLRVGASVVWIDHCTELTFRVVGHEIASPGDLLNPPRGGRGLALITCYPTNALFYTPDRYVLLTSLVSKTKAATTPGPVHVVTPHLSVPAPRALVAQGLGLANSGVLVGYMHVTGAPSPGYLQGPASLDLEALALESYIGAEKAVAQHDTKWWKALAVPGLAMPSSLWSNSLDTNVTEHVVGNTVESVTLSSANETCVLVASHHKLLIERLVTS